MIPLAIAGFFKKVWEPLLVFAVIAVVVFWGLHHVYGLGQTAGRAEVQLKWDKAEAVRAKAVDVRKDAQAKVTKEVEIQYVDRWNTIVEQGATVIKKVPVYVPANTPDLPAGMRVLHDAAATGTDPDSLSVATGSTAPRPVPAQDFATTVTENYTGCRRNAADLDAWNAWADKQEALSLFAPSGTSP